MIVHMDLDIYLYLQIKQYINVLHMSFHPIKIPFIHDLLY